jgi:hypothetical protein
VLPALVAKHNDDEEAGRAWRLLLVAAFGFAAAMLFADRASLAAGTRDALGAIAGESVDPSQRARILAEIAPEYSGRGTVMIADGLLCLGIFAAPLAAAAGAKRKFSIPGIVAGVAAALVILFGYLAGARLDRDVTSLQEPFEKMTKTLAAAKIDLPVVRDGAEAEMLSTLPDYLVTRDGTLSDIQAAAAPSSEPLDEEDLAALRMHRGHTFAADGALAFDAFMNKAGQKALDGSPTSSLVLVARPATPHDMSALGALAGLVGPDLRGFSAGLVRRLADGLPEPPNERPWEAAKTPSSRVLAVLPQADVAKLVLLVRALPGEPGTLLTETLPLGDGLGEDRRRVLQSVHDAHPGVGTLVLAPAPADTIARVTAVLEMLHAASSYPRDDVVLTPDRAALEQATSAIDRPGSGIRLRDLQVKGSLASVPVAFVLRRSAHAFVICHTGATAGGEVPSEIALRFSIDSSGNVVRPSAGPTRNLLFGKCVELATSNLVFPSADGLATVTVKLEFP